MKVKVGRHSELITVSSVLEPPFQLVIQFKQLLEVIVVAKSVKRL